MAAAPSVASAARLGAVPARLQALMAMALGLVIVGIVGFAQIDAVHNAAHDLRHANGFPCH